MNGSCRDFLYQAGTTGGAAESAAKTLDTRHLATRVAPLDKAPRAMFRPNG